MVDEAVPAQTLLLLNDSSDDEAPFLSGVAKPFIKWAGGKTSLLKELIIRKPTHYQRYIEAFAGGAALFFALQPTEAILIDTNSDLISTYKTVRDNCNGLIKELKKHQYERDHYYEMRDVDRSSRYNRWSDLKKAARLIYLNKSCYNGLYRVNSKGQFNVPFGRYSNPRIVDQRNLKACSLALANCDIRQASFELVEKLAKKGDFIYFDPPYMPLSKTANFTSYSAEGFNEAKQEALLRLCQRLSKKKINFMLSNSDQPLIREMYSSFNIDVVECARAINSKGSKRGKISELIIRNYL